MFWPGSPSPVERPVQRALGVEDEPPRVDTHEVADPERYDRRDEEQDAQTRARYPYEEERVRESEDDARERDGCRDAHGAERDPPVRRVVPQRSEVVEAPGVDDLARELVQRPKGGDEQGDERCDIHEEERRKRQSELSDGLGARPPPGERGRCSEGPLSPRALRGRSGVGRHGEVPTPSPASRPAPTSSRACRPCRGCHRSR